MTVDFHTHIFPPEIITNRDRYAAEDATFAEIYANPSARLATAEELLASMDSASVDVCVTAGFAWKAQSTCSLHNDYLLSCAARSQGRLVTFATVNPAAPGAEEEAERCVAGGAVGLGELRPDNQGWDPVGPSGQLLAAIAAKHNLALLFHVSEPVGHFYPGKGGGSLAGFHAFASSHPDVTIIGAHLAGGLAFYAPMPEVRELLSRIYLDTSAMRLLYDDAVLDNLSWLVREGRILFGSDFPLATHERAVNTLALCVPDPDLRECILNTNGRQLLSRLGVPPAT